MSDSGDLAQEIQQRSGENITLCYQCLKCSVGCPLSTHMEFRPNTVIRMIQYGEREELLKSHAIWLCVSCMTCGARCPNDIDMSTVFDTLREMSLEAGLALKSESKVVKLHQEFVRNIRMFGRLHETTFFIPYIFRSLDVLSNAVSGFLLMARGKLPLLPKQIKGIEAIEKLYKEAYKTQKQIDEADARRASADKKAEV